MTITAFLNCMKHSPISNYGGIPGLTSWLIGVPGERGLVRLMECSREHQEPIVPHSHRFDFQCQVLAGSVRNVIWTRSASGDQFQATAMRYSGQPGCYLEAGAEVDRWATITRAYKPGEWYSMRSDQVHSIFFARGTSVLFFEGPQLTDTNIVLEPFVDGAAVPTFRVEPWAFKRGAA